MSELVHPVAYFYDKDLIRQIPRNELGQALAQMSKTPPGSTNELTIYILNVMTEKISLSGYIENPAVKMEYPKILEPNQKGDVKFTYTADKKILNSLSTEWGFDIEVG